MPVARCKPSRVLRYMLRISRPPPDDVSIYIYIEREICIYIYIEKIGIYIERDIFICISLYI